MSKQEAGGERVATLESEVKSLKEHMATKKEVSDVKVWVLGGALTAIVSAIGIVLILVRTFPLNDCPPAEPCPEVLSTPALADSIPENK